MFTTCVCARCVCLEFLMDLYRSMLHAALTSWIVRELSVLGSFMVSVDVKLYATLRHW